MSRISEKLHGEVYGMMPGFKEPTTSRDAALAIAPSASLLRERVFAAIRDAGPSGLTADEAAERVSASVLAARPRVTELVKTGRIIPTGERRRNGSRLSAKVWRTT